MNKTYMLESSNTEDTIKISSILAKKLSEGMIICLDGDLGVGKTIFAQGLINSLGEKGYISSPTFTIVNEYQGKHKIYHIDAYRLNTNDEAFDIGIDEYITSNGISIIEWAKNIKEILPSEYMEISIHKNLDIADSYRKIIFKPYGVLYENIADSTCVEYTKS